MSFEWLSWSNPVALWWIFLVSVSVLNMAAWTWTWRYFKNKNYGAYGKLTKTLIVLSGLYVFGCAFRSFLPRADVQKICLFDTWFSTVLVGRFVATIAEVSFICQWAIVIHRIALELKSSLAKNIAMLIVVLICTAECFSWYAVITTHYLGNTIEESLWGVSYFLIAVSLFVLAKYLNKPMKLAALFTVFGSLLYVVFMARVDVPMYFNRWQADRASGKVIYGLFEGLHHLATEWNVTRDIADWKDEIPWMSLYFSVAVWTSLILCYVPLNRERIQKK